MDDARPIVRCPSCSLRQFQTHDGNCRKCHHSLIRRELAMQPEPPPPRRKILPVRTGGGGWGEVLAVFRQERGLSQRQLAIKAHCGRTFISKIENRFQPPTYETVVRFADALNVPFSALVSADNGRNYYCEHYLASDPFLSELQRLGHDLDKNQWQIIVDAVRSLACEHQTSFPEWEVIPASSSLGVQPCTPP